MRRRRSPATPPNPVGSGHVPITGSEARARAARKVAPIQAAKVNQPKDEARPKTRRQAQTTGGRSRAIAARPKNCMMMSATIAPGRPSALRGSWSVAWLRLGSSTVQVARLAAIAADRASSPRPDSAPRFRRSSRRTALSPPGATSGIALVDRIDASLLRDATLSLPGCIATARADGPAQGGKGRPFESRPSRCPAVPAVALPEPYRGVGKAAINHRSQRRVRPETKGARR